jgi:hypothetical protein
MTFRGSDAIPGPTVSFKDPDGPDNKHDGVVPGGTNQTDVPFAAPKPVRPNENPATGWLYPDKPGIE